MSIGISAKYELIQNTRISHLFKLFLVPGKIFNTITKPIMHTESTPKPIMNRRSPPNRPIKSPIIIVIAPIGPVIPIITIAFRAVSNSGQLNVLLPAMDKEQAVPIGVFLLPDDSLLAGAGTDPRVAAKSPEAFCELSQYQIGDAFLN